MKKLAFITLLGSSILCPSEWNQVHASFGSASEHEVREKAVVEMVYESQVDRYVRQYLRSSEEATLALSERANKYFPMIEQKLDAAGLPVELKYLTLVESRLIPYARSRAGASGMWQLMVPTARYCGLTVDYWVDERLDPERSTDAAIFYLKDLYDQFDDWALVMAAYNAGPGRVRKAIRYSGSTEFERIAPFLPRETRQYVPRFLAAQEYFKAAEVRFAAPYLPNPDEWWTTTVRLTTATSLKNLAEQLKLNIQLLRRLNPAWKHDRLGDVKGKYSVRIPQRVLPIWWESQIADPDEGSLKETGSTEGESLIFSAAEIREVNVRLRATGSIRDLADDLSINPYRIAAWNQLSVDRDLPRGTAIKIFMPESHDCGERLSWLMHAEKQLPILPPKEIRVLTQEGPGIPEQGVVAPSFTRAGMPTGQPIDGGIPSAMREDVFSEILRRKEKVAIKFTAHSGVAVDASMFYPSI